MRLIFGVTAPRNIKQAVPTIVNTLIQPEVLSKYTWTGKSSSKAVKKNAFRSLTEILDIIFQTMRAIDDKYTLDKLSHDITYNVLKYAYKNDKEI